jgi:tetratricopeptide (TPR) repeat protein
VAAESFKNALKVDQENRGDAYFLLAVTLMQMERYEEAASIFKKAGSVKGGVKLPKMM